MKKIYVLMVATVLALTVQAAKTDLHLLSFYVGGGYSGMVSYGGISGDFTSQTWQNGAVLDLKGTAKNSFIGGGGGLIGVNYEYRHQRLLLDVGPEFRLFTSADKLNFTAPYSAQMDYQGMYKHYMFDKGLKETQVVGQVMVPVMIGAMFGDVARYRNLFYALAGVKVGFTLMNTYKQNSPLTTSVMDSWAVDEWYNIGHDMQTATYATASQANLMKGLDVALSAEFGVNINELLSKAWNDKNAVKDHPLHFRAGFFVDYGLPLIQVPTAGNIQAGTGVLTMLGGGDKQLATTSIHQSEWAQSNKLGSLMVGVKGVFLLQLNKPKKVNPTLELLVKNSFTDKAIGGATVTYQTTDQKRNKTKQKKTNSKGVAIYKNMPPANYNVSVSAPGYLPSDKVNIDMEADYKAKKENLEVALIPEPKLSFQVFDKATHKHIIAKVKFVNEGTGKSETISVDTASNVRGIAKLMLGEKYHVEVSASKYLDSIFDINDLYNMDPGYEFYLQPKKQPKKWVLENMFFATAKDIILPESEPSLQLLFNFLSENPNTKIKIIGHTDSVGKDADNQDLSERRAANVKKAMVERGIDEKRIKTEGKGESQPIDTNDTEEGRQHNRRVEIQVLN